MQLNTDSEYSRHCQDYSHHTLYGDMYLVFNSACKQEAYCL